MAIRSDPRFKSNESGIEPQITFAIKYNKNFKVIPLFIPLFLSFYIKYRIMAISLPSSLKNQFIHFQITCFIINYHKTKCNLFFYLIILIILPGNVSKSIVSQFLTKIVIQRFLKWRLFVLDSFGRIREYLSTLILVAALIIIISDKMKEMITFMFNYKISWLLIDLGQWSKCF